MRIKVGDIVTIHFNHSRSIFRAKVKGVPGEIDRFFVVITDDFKVINVMNFDCMEKLNEDIAKCRMDDKYNLLPCEKLNEIRGVTTPGGYMRTNPEDYIRNRSFKYCPFCGASLDVVPI